MATCINTIPQVRNIKRIIATFGGRRKVAQICEIDISLICKWRLFIPGDHVLRLYKHALQTGIAITLEELRPDIFGNVIEELMPEQENNFDRLTREAIPVNNRTPLVFGHSKRFIG